MWPVRLTGLASAAGFEGVGAESGLASLALSGSAAIPVVNGTVPLASAVRIGAAMLLVVCRPLSRLRIGFSSGKAAERPGLSAVAVTLGSGLWVNRSGCAKSTGDNSPGAITTRAPIRVQPYIRTAKFIGMRTQPCEAG